MLQSMAAAAERVFEFLEEDEEENNAENPVAPEKIEGNVEFEHVKFGYDPNKIIISDFSADIAKGQTVAIVGPTGAGKTTMVKLLMRFYDVNGGSIKVDGHDIREFERSSAGSFRYGLAGHMAFQRNYYGEYPLRKTRRHRR